MGDLSWRFDEREYSYVKEVLDSGFGSSTSGSMNSRFEKAFSERFNMDYAVTFNSGTTTLHAALWALGVRYGDEVITTPLTVISCMNAILYCNAIPVFADVDSETFLIDPDDIERKITSKTKAILAVHLYGQVCEMDRIMAIAKKYNLKVVEDCAQCYLGTHKGKIAGTIGDIGSWSLENSKHLTTGDGGIIACNDEKLAVTIRKLNTQGFRNATAKSGQIRVDKRVYQDPAFKRHDTFGFMYRLPEVAAALGLAQIEKIDWFVDKRKQMAEMYREVMKDSDLFHMQKIDDQDEHSYYTFAAKFVSKEISWYEFRDKYRENGGDGVYAAWTLCYLEDSIAEIKELLDSIGLSGRFNTEKGICPNAEKIQTQLMQFTTNQKDESEMRAQAEALRKTIAYFTDRNRSE